MRFVTVATAMIFALAVQSDTPVAQGRGNGQVKKTSVSTPKAKPSIQTPKHTAPTLTTTVISPETPTTHAVRNPKLEARLLTMLPAGTNVHDASQGFKNWGQFVAAVHVSNNLNIPFADLKARMTGFMPGTVPGSSVQTARMSLGQAIQSFKGTTGRGILSPARIQTEVKKAEDAANTTLRRSRETS